MNRLLTSLKTMTDFLDNLANDQHQKMLREINNDNQTPRNKRKVNADGLFETSDCSDPDHICTCGSQQVTLTED